MLLHLERRDSRRFSRDCGGILLAHPPTQPPPNPHWTVPRSWHSHQGVLVHSRNSLAEKNSLLSCQDIISYLHGSKRVITGSPLIGRGAFLFQHKWRLLWDGKEMRGKRGRGMTLRRSDKQTWFTRFHALLTRETLAEGDHLSRQSSPEKLDVATRCHVFQTPPSSLLNSTRGIAQWRCRMDDNRCYFSLLIV